MLAFLGVGDAHPHFGGPSHRVPALWVSRYVLAGAFPVKLEASSHCRGNVGSWMCQCIVFRWFLMVNGGIVGDRVRVVDSKDPDQTCLNCSNEA
jgi:hypothetical protein